MRDRIEPVELTPFQTRLRNSARELFERHCPGSRVRELIASDEAHDPELWRRFAQEGWLGLLLPEACGGQGGGVTDLTVLMEELGRAAVPGSFGATVCAASLWQELGGDRSELNRVAAGESRLAIAWHEAVPGWEPEAVRLSLDDRASRLSGVKTLVSGVPGADRLLCFVRERGELAVVSLPVSRQGVRIEKTPSIDLTRPMGQIRFENVAVKPHEILGRGPRVETAWQRLERLGTLVTCADLVGVMQRLVEESLSYARRRRQFGRPIGDFQLVQQLCADMLSRTETARSVVFRAAQAWDATVPAGEELGSVAKIWCSDAGREVGEKSIQLHGGVGVTWDCDLHLYLRRAKAGELQFGDADFHRERLAAQLLDD